jgi:hypothetical protein
MNMLKEEHIKHFMKQVISGLDEARQAVNNTSQQDKVWLNLTGITLDRVFIFDNKNLELKSKVALQLPQFITAM